MAKYYLTTPFCETFTSREEAAGVISAIWYYHEAAAGAYHAIERRADGPRRSYHALFCIDPETHEARSYSGPLPSRYQAEAVLHHLAPDAVRLDGLPAFMR